LWEREKLQGLEEGLKERPSVVVLMVGGNPDRPVLTVCPVTSQKPKLDADHVEMPLTVKHHLGLTDRDRSYIMTTEINTFTWPGPDIRPFERAGKVEICYGQIPRKLLQQVKDSMISNIRSHKLKTTPRD